MTKEHSPTPSGLLSEFICKEINRVSKIEESFKRLRASLEKQGQNVDNLPAPPSSRSLSKTVVMKLAPARATQPSLPILFSYCALTLATLPSKDVIPLVGKKNLNVIRSDPRFRGWSKVVANSGVPSKTFQGIRQAFRNPSQTHTRPIVTEYMLHVSENPSDAQKIIPLEEVNLILRAATEYRKPPPHDCRPLHNLHIGLRKWIQDCVDNRHL